MKTISLTIITLFSLIGLFAFTTVIHEYSHYLDYKQVSGNTGDVCLFDMPANNSLSEWMDIGGSYSFSVNTKDGEKMKAVDRINKYTEWKAYGIALFIGLFWCIALVVLWYEHWLDTSVARMLRRGYGVQ